MLQLQHHIVSILYSIKGLSESHLLRAEEGHLEKLEERLNHAEQALKKIYAQSEEALKITKRIGKAIKNEPSAQNRSKTSVQKTVQSIRKLLEQEFDFKDFEFVQRVHPEFPAISCNRNDFKEMLYHLMKNAMQAMTGEVRRLVIRSQIFNSLEGKSHALISVSDTGMGIPLEQMDKLFQPFFTTKPAGIGNGLGLFLARQLVLRNQGRISASSFPACGTTFTLEFPIFVQKESSSKF